MDRISANLREEKGTAAAKKLRSSGLIPGVVYGHKTGTIEISLDEKELLHKTHGIAGGHLYDLVIDGDESKKKRTVLVKEFQKDPVKGKLQHVDFQQIALDEKIETHVPIWLVGEAIGVKEGGVLDHHLRDLSIRVLPADMPDHIQVEISEVKIGDAIRVNALTVPGNVEVLNDPEDIVMAIHPPAKVVEEVPEEVEVEEEEAAAPVEPEVVGKKEEEGSGEE